MNKNYEYFLEFLERHSNKRTLLKWCPDCKDLTLHGFGKEFDTNCSPVNVREYMFCMGCGKREYLTPWYIPKYF